MKFRENAKYDLVCPTSMGVRITPNDRQTVQLSNLYRMQATSAESNVLSISAALGLKTKVLTTFVKGSQIASFIKADLRKRGIDYEGAEVSKGGPWGYRHQFNIADSGYGLRAPVVENDRAGEVGRTLNVKDFDLERIFNVEGVKLLHLSGLIAALSPETSKFCLELARYANVHTQKPLTESELKFIYRYPDIAAKVMTVSPFFKPDGELEKRLRQEANALNNK
jgi:2-dehydro-3-deoxygluconokinase